MTHALEGQNGRRVHEPSHVTHETLTNGRPVQLCWSLYVPLHYNLRLYIVFVQNSHLIVPLSIQRITHFIFQWRTRWCSPQSGCALDRSRPGCRHLLPRPSTRPGLGLSNHELQPQVRYAVLETWFGNARAGTLIGSLCIYECLRLMEPHYRRIEL